MQWEAERRHVRQPFLSGDLATSTVLYSDGGGVRGGFFLYRARRWEHCLSHEPNDVDLACGVGRIFVSTIRAHLPCPLG